MLKCILKNSYIVIFIFIFSCKGPSLIIKEGKECNSKSIQHTNAYKLNNVTIDYNAKLITKDKKISGKITLTDNILLINGVYTSLGIEVFRILSKGDSIIYLDRVNKRYYNGSLNDFYKINEYKALIPYLKNVLTGKLFDSNSLVSTDDSLYYNKVGSDKVLYSFNSYCQLDKLNFTSGVNKFVIHYSNMDNKHGICKTVDISNKEGSFVELNYSNIHKYKGNIPNLRVPKNYISY